MPVYVCPTCHKAFSCKNIRDHVTFPFCSTRCRDAELGAWLDGRYVISRPLAQEEAERPREKRDAPSPPDAATDEEGAGLSS